MMYFGGIVGLFVGIFACLQLHFIFSHWHRMTPSIFVSSVMTSSNGNIFRVTGHLCGEFTCHRWIPRAKASDAELWWFHWSTHARWSLFLYPLGLFHSLRDRYESVSELTQWRMGKLTTLMHYELSHYTNYRKWHVIVCISHIVSCIFS